MKALCLSLLIIVTSHFVYADSWQSKYTPTKLEWLVMKLNAEYRIDSEISENQISIRFYEKFPNGVIVRVLYNSRVDRRHLNRMVEHSKEVVKMHAKDFKMSIKIEEELTILN